MACEYRDCGWWVSDCGGCVCVRWFSVSHFQLTSVMECTEPAFNVIQNSETVFMFKFSYEKDF